MEGIADKVKHREVIIPGYLATIKGELEEELGVPANLVTILGQLHDLYLFVTDYLVTPWVATTDRLPKWSPQDSEVAEVLELPLPHLLDPANTDTYQRNARGVAFRSPQILLDGHQVWGATSIILGELKELLEHVQRDASVS